MAGRNIRWTVIVTETSVMSPDLLKPFGSVMLINIHVSSARVLLKVYRTDTNIKVRYALTNTNIYVIMFGIMLYNYRP